MFRSMTSNTGALVKFIVRKERIRIPLWLVGIIFFTIIAPITFDDMYTSQEERDTLAKTMRNPAMIAMVGPGDFENYTTGVMTAHNMLLLTAVVVGLMSILLVIRHTRADEEDGRIELIRSLPVGRQANLNATLIVLVGTNVILALAVGFGLYGLGIDSIGLNGSMLYGAALGCIGRHWYFLRRDYCHICTSLGKLTRSNGLLYGLPADCLSYSRGWRCEQ
ncbi:hypothetical protein [Metasolibacillus meyeri]|uniref:hypothetical protein n=1 Tax=Metasolibacillus meyeri TaxID=1071052 RepID=UPI002DBDFC9B|nr:hypothetical protein [Metasolibacillus meyeri]